MLTYLTFLNLLPSVSPFLWDLFWKKNSTKGLICHLVLKYMSYAVCSVTDLRIDFIVQLLVWCQIIWQWDRNSLFMLLLFVVWDELLCLLVPCHSSSFPSWPTTFASSFFSSAAIYVTSGVPYFGISRLLACFLFSCIGVMLYPLFLHWWPSPTILMTF